MALSLVWLAAMSVSVAFFFFFLRFFLFFFDFFFLLLRFFFLLLWDLRPRLSSELLELVEVELEEEEEDEEEEPPWADASFLSCSRLGRTDLPREDPASPHLALNSPSSSGSDTPPSFPSTRLRTVPAPLP